MNSHIQFTLFFLRDVDYLIANRFKCFDEFGRASNTERYNVKRRGLHPS